MYNRKGVTFLELVIVLVIGGVLTAVAVGGFSTLQGRMGARGAQSALLSMHAQTRAIAVEQGGRARLIVDPSNAIVSIDLLTDPAGTPALVESRDFGSEFRATIETGGGSVILCMTPRGYADASCNSFAQQARVRLTAGGRSENVVFLPLGQALIP